MLSKISNPVEQKKTSAIMISGDSLLEKQMSVGSGFPQNELKQGEIIVLQDVLDVIGSKPGDKVEIHYEVF